MSTLAELLDRLTGIAMVKTRLDQQSDRLEKLASFTLDLAQRVARMEGALTGSPKQLPKSK
jgi:hypothetical protein